MIRRPSLLMAVAVLVAAVAPLGGGVHQPPRWTYRPPVTGVVVDPFRPPPAPWLSGNRGLEYAVAAGSVVSAIGPGVVTFAGALAGRRIVTVTHPDGLRSSYVGLAAVLVALGDRVEGGQPVGLAAERLHLGVRRGQTYLDPASLFGSVAGGGRVVLVPDRTAWRALTGGWWS